MLRMLVQLTPWIYAMCVLQTALAPTIAWRGAVPHFIVLGTLAAVWRLPGCAGFNVAVACGVVTDGLAPDSFGAGLISFSLAAWATQQLRQLPFRGRSGAAALLCGLTVWSTQFLTGLIHAAPPETAAGWAALILAGLGSAAYTALIAGVAVFLAKVAGIAARPSDSANRVNRWNMLTE